MISEDVHRLELSPAYIRDLVPALSEDDKLGLIAKLTGSLESSDKARGLFEAYLSREKNKALEENLLLSIGMNGKELLQTEIDKPPFLINDLWAQGATAMLHGPGGSNKTWAIMSMLVCMAKG